MSKIALLLSLLALGVGAFALVGKDDRAHGAATLALSNADIDTVARRLQEEIQKAAQARDLSAQRELDTRLKKLQVVP